MDNETARDVENWQKGLGCGLILGFTLGAILGAWAMVGGLP